MSDPVEQRASREALACSHVPLRFRTTRREDVELTSPAISKAVDALDVLFNLDAKNLALFGPVGCGKSMIAAIACHEEAETWVTGPIHEQEEELEKLKADFTPMRGIKPYSVVDGDVVANEAYEPITALAASIDELERKLRGSRRKVASECPRWISVPLLLNGLRREFRKSDEDLRPMHKLVEDVIERYDAGLVLDDIGSEKASDWTAETLFEMVEARYSRNAGPVIVTSNRTPRELAAMGYERIISRIAEDGIVLEMTSATDYRMRRRKSIA